MQLEPGLKVKHYTLEQCLGSGSSGEVWKASDGEKTVAVKFMNERLVTSNATNKYLKNLESEIKALGLLNHPNIPALYDHDLSFERPYLVMEYISSPPYDRLIATGEMFHVRMHKRLELLRTVASTITAAHKKGIIHRDIKPGNINGTETPYLLDFSIALETRYAAHSRPDVGTGIYMPPPDGPPDALSDNYSFALVAYEVLFGQHAIFTPQDTTGTVMEIRALAGERLGKREWRLPSQLSLEELPGDLRGADLFLLDAIFEKALGPREGRYIDLTRFVDELKGAILIDSNQHYLETHDPLPPAFRERIPTEAEWTQNEVSVELRLTNPDEHAPYPTRKIPLWLISGALIVILIIVIVILILSRAG